MKTVRTNRLLSLILCVLLIAALALTATGCSGSKTNNNVSSEGPYVSSEQTIALGKGEKTFTFTVVFADGGEKHYTVSTDKQTVGEALLELGLIDGEQSDYGLYVKKVDGVNADYDTDGTYWAFYVNGEYASYGVDGTDIVPGSTYSLKIEK